MKKNKRRDTNYGVKYILANIIIYIRHYLNDSTNYSRHKNYSNDG